jgi:hypothetical protein
MVPSGDQEEWGGLGANAGQGEQAGRAGGHQGDDQIVGALHLVIEELGAPSQFPQGEPGGIAGRVAGPRAQ